MKQPFSKDILVLDTEKEADKICGQIRTLMTKQLKRRGLVVALSGGIDSSVSVGLASKALGPDRVVALLMPERHSSENTLDLSKSVADTFGVKWYHEDISACSRLWGFTSDTTMRFASHPRIRRRVEIKIVIPT